ncbi:NADP-dependent succinic semialdehyde dehydrogenase [Phycicoccus duodecadis]|uniref:Succinate-semialdehyde dehydrogenase/glutarate-semialdehyde dehydrogenase n=1 Tax=Phycicoccus duodecadis TaxID=173053 RepID=A0A2N3YGK2_9MICO|nr:NADP-dependent succinic semialdehyde dehydrogenase [Phycicoccus duodecadis]PKW25985.1 succinate-semialdehyde dehydrogenase/glutarate-semialdehyde dehydrogenase [Phycicoccus duodecadis]
MPIATVNPFTGVTEETFTAHTPEEVQEALARAVRAQRDLRERTFAERAGWLRRAAELLEAEVDTAAAMMTVEMGKPIAQSEAEVRKCAKGMRFYADHAEAMLADTPLADASAVGAGAAWTRWEPLGVVLAVMPWNFPLWQVVRFAAPALMAGNTGLLKHASNVPRSAVYLEDVLSRAGFPEGCFQTLLIGSDAVAAVLDDERVVAVTLTGSEPAGRSVAARAGAGLKKAVLELGGSDPFVVMPSADLDAAVATAVTSRTLNNGQSCVCAKRFVVHTDVYDDFAARFTARMAALVVGDPLDPATDIGPLATRAGRDELAELVQDAVDRGATVLTGGTVPERDGWFYEPTVLADLPEGTRLVMEEAFGPVATLYRVGDRDEALRVANQTSFGLSSSVWTTDADEQDWFTARLEAGAVFVNGMTASFPELPFGGVKASGYGRELAAEGIREFCNLKTVWRA